MAERKCSNCRETGHTKATCLQAHDPVRVDEFLSPATETTKGPWFGAQFPGICEGCGRGFEEGDQIRSDGSGGWECESWCGQDDSVPLARDRHWERPTAANVKMPEPVDPAPTAIDQFLSPAAVAGEPEQHPDKKTEQRGYICKDPVLGDFRWYKNGKKKGITRATTFNKHAMNSKGITDWNKRNIIIGAVRRPDLVAQAHGLDVNADKAALMRIANQLEDAAGGNVASAMGTDVHLWTERVDAGDARLDDVPPQYRRTVELYVAGLREHGFHIVPELRERTTFIEEFGGIAGTFDAILYHEPSGTYRMSDTKTGKSMDYGWDEIETQEWIYVHGYNRFGTYNWDTHEWEAPQHRVSTDHGVVVHLPVAGPLAGTCSILMTDLAAGAKHAELCALVRDSGKSKAQPWVNPPRDWVLAFSSVKTPDQANALWREAKAEGLPDTAMTAYKTLAKNALQKAMSTVDMTAGDA